MNRRQFLFDAAALGAAGTAFAPAIARTVRRPQEAFASSFDRVHESFGPSTVRFDRPLPAGLAGTLFRNGPARMQRGDTRYHHWFDGDGMIQSFVLHGETLEHRARMVRTSRYEAEEQAGRFLWPGFGTTFADARPVKTPDTVNVANISVLPVGNELLALWEAGSPWRIDPVTLRTRGRKVFSDEADGLAFSAHPRVDPDGRIWNYGYASGSGRLVLYDLSPDGKPNRITTIEAPNADMVHDFVVTESHLVFVLPPLHQLPAESAAPRAFVDTLRWASDEPVIVLLVDKRTLQPVRRYELSPFFAFHFGNAWQDGDSIRVDVAQAPPFHRLMQAIEATTKGESAPPLASMPALQLVLETRGAARARLETLPVAGIEFPGYDLRHTGRPTSRLVALSSASSQPEGQFGFNEVMLLDHATQSIQRHDYGANVLAEEHVFVPRPGAPEGQGWLLGTTFDWRKGTTDLNVLDADLLDAGPIATARLPYALPLGLHGRFVAA